MLGRAAYQQPYLLADVDSRLFGESSTPPRRAEVIEGLIPYAEQELRRGTRLIGITRHILGLYHGCAGGRLYRRYLSENACQRGAGIEVIREASAIAEAAMAGVSRDRH
jgi:tRNA-dihydrouridine synthase A